MRHILRVTAILVVGVSWTDCSHAQVDIGTTRGSAAVVPEWGPAQPGEVLRLPQEPKDLLHLTRPDKEEFSYYEIREFSGFDTKIDSWRSLYEKGDHVIPPFDRFPVTDPIRIEHPTTLLVLSIHRVKIRQNPRDAEYANLAEVRLDGGKHSGKRLYGDARQLNRRRPKPAEPRRDNALHPVYDPVEEEKARQREEVLSRARSLEKAREAEAASRVYRSLIRTHPGTAQAKTAEERLRALGSPPSDEETVDRLMRKGDNYFSGGDFGNAQVLYELVLNRDPGHAEAYLGRANAWERLGSIREAIDDYRSAADLSLEHRARAVNDAAWIAATWHDDKSRPAPHLAIEYAKRALALSTTNRDQVFDTMAAAYANSGDFETAIVWERKAIEAAPADSPHLPEYDGRLDLYRARRPHREPPPR